MLTVYSTADEIQAAGVDTAVLPVGSTEQHGPHLPIATDTIISEIIGEKIAESLGALLLPALPISTCREHMGKKGSVWMNPVTFFQMIQDIVSSLSEQGFRRVIIIQGHGGIFMLTPVVREINATSPAMKVIRVDPYAAGPTDDLLSCRDNLHACEAETSLMLFLKEDVVRKEKIVDHVPPVPRDYLNYASILKFCPDGVWGQPSLATADKGRKLLNRLVQNSMAYIQDVEKIFSGTAGGQNQS